MQLPGSPDCARVGKPAQTAVRSVKDLSQAQPLKRSASFCEGEGREAFRQAALMSVLNSVNRAADINCLVAITINWYFGIDVAILMYIVISFAICAAGARRVARGKQRRCRLKESRGCAPAVPAPDTPGERKSSERAHAHACY